jgi:hypothetical protein
VKRYDVDWDNPTILTDGMRLYVRMARGVYAEMSRRGKRKGGICSGFWPKPRWRPARRCEYDERRTLTCERCGYYDNQYAETGIRSFCMKQGRYVL